MTRYEAWTLDDEGPYRYADRETGEDGRLYGRIGSEIVNVRLVQGQPDPQQQSAIDQFKRSRYKRAYKAIMARYPEAAAKAVIREGGSMQVIEKTTLLATSREREHNVGLAHPAVPAPYRTAHATPAGAVYASPPLQPQAQPHAFEPLLEATMLDPPVWAPGEAY